MAIDNKFKSDAFTRIYDVWARRNPGYEKHYEAEVIKPLTDFGLGTNEASEAKGKVLGAGYEALIMAFFIGLYSNKKLPLDPYTDIKDLRQPIQYWGNLDSKKGRKAYSRLREYIFVAVVARTPEIDWIALDKDKWTVNETVALLMTTMEEYINYGLSILSDKLREDESYFYNKNAFIDLFKELTHTESEAEKGLEADKPDEL